MGLNSCFIFGKEEQNSALVSLDEEKDRTEQILRELKQMNNPDERVEFSEEMKQMLREKRAIRSQAIKQHLENYGKISMSFNEKRDQIIK